MEQGRTRRQSRAAENQSLFRSVNNRVKELNELFDAFTPYGDWACECSDLLCLERIQLTLAEYEQLRRHPNRFAVAPGEDHVDPDVERVTEQTERYWVVEKIGAGASRAAELHRLED